MDQQLDQLEKLIGSWEPTNKFSSVYDTFDELCSKIDGLEPLSY